MQKVTGMNQSTLIGLMAATLLVIGMLAMASDHIAAFFNIPGLIVVIGGTLAATVISRPAADVRRVLRNLPAMLRQPRDTFEPDAAQLLQFAARFRHGSLRVAEQEIMRVTNPFLRAGLRAVIDRMPREELGNTLQRQVAAARAREQGQIQILYAMAGFAPAFGMLGTLFGLVHMLSGLGSSGLEAIGSSMAFAMITTVYGILASNLLFKPLAIKLEREAAQRLLQMRALSEGVLQIQERRHPMLIKESLQSFFGQPRAAAPASAPLTLVRA